ncbi:hypothetical protein [Aureibacillus halotolerans]|uniref:hypothetical protein n=1 Tax=Aureibacillus halotolerans TaxID=1508390 RepID=UPI00105BB6C2|nr:hypothetical protein [Aureibacillus halotolerans]
MNDFPSDKLVVFEGPEDITGSRIQAVLPASPSYKDYPVRVKELIYALAEIEDRPVEDILVDVAKCICAIKRQ